MANVTGKGLPRSLKGVTFSASWNDITGKPATFTPTVGATATTAMAGNKVPTTTQRGGVILQAAQADSAAAPTQAEFNALLTKLRSAGIITP